MSIKEGIISSEEDTIRVLRNGDAIAVVRLSKPIIVAQAQEIEKWGYFQFPTIFRAENGNLIVFWQMKSDTYEAYGTEGAGFKMSKDEGSTWEPIDRVYFKRRDNRIEYPNGDVIEVYAPKSQDISKYSEFPSRVNAKTIAGYDFYNEYDLPDELKGAYLHYWNCQTQDTVLIHAYINDPLYLKYTVNGIMPFTWAGTIKELNDGSFVTGVYPCYYQNKEGLVLSSAVTFYKSTDKGQHWDVLGRIPYQPDKSKSPEDMVFDGNPGFCEPSFEILKDGRFFCVLRSSGDYSPMYYCISQDEGKTWSIPEMFTPNGVRPRLFYLDNGVLVLASGRPGLQIRLNIEGDGVSWTEPIEMMPFLDKDGKYATLASQRESCGYASVYIFNKNTFYLAYSDFRTKNQRGEERKSIMFRKIQIIKR